MTHVYKQAQSWKTVQTKRKAFALIVLLSPTVKQFFKKLRPPCLQKVRQRQFSVISFVLKMVLLTNSPCDGSEVKSAQASGIFFSPEIASKSPKKPFEHIGTIF